MLFEEDIYCRDFHVGIGWGGQRRILVCFYVREGMSRNSPHEDYFSLPGQHRSELEWPHEGFGCYMGNGLAAVYNSYVGR